MAFGKGNLAGGKYYVGDILTHDNITAYYEKKVTEDFNFNINFTYEYDKIVHDNDYIYFYVAKELTIYKYSIEEYNIVAKYTVPIDIKYLLIYPKDNIIEYGHYGEIYRVYLDTFKVKEIVNIRGLDFEGTPNTVLYLSPTRVLLIDYYEIKIFDLNTRKSIFRYTNDGKTREIKKFGNSIFRSSVSGNLNIWDFDGNEIKSFSIDSSERYFAHLTELEDGSIVYGTEASDNSSGADRAGLITKVGNSYSYTRYSTSGYRNFAEYDGYIYAHTYWNLHKFTKDTFQPITNISLSNGSVSNSLFFSRVGVPMIYKNQIYSFLNLVQTGYKIIN